LDGKRDTGWSIKGAAGQPHAAVFNLAEPIQADGGILLQLTLEQFYVHQHTLGRFRVAVADAPEHVAASGFPHGIEATLLIPAAERDAAQRSALTNYFLLHTPELAEQQKAIAERIASIPKF